MAIWDAQGPAGLKESGKTLWTQIRRRVERAVPSPAQGSTRWVWGGFSGHRKIEAKLGSSLSGVGK